MEFLNTTTKTMQQTTTWWQDLINWAKDNTIVWCTFVLGWKGIDKGFKYLTSGRKAEIIAIVKEEVGKSITPQIEKLSSSIDSLRESIWDLKK